MRCVLLLATTVVLTACASTPPQPPRAEFPGIPVPEGLALETDRSTIIESDRIKAARLVYRGRLEPESLANLYRSTLETSGWRHVSSTSTGKGFLQVYEKPGGSLQVSIYEGGLFNWYTWVEVAATHLLAPGPSAPAAAR